MFLSIKGVATPPSSGDGKSMIVKGRNLATGVPQEIELNQVNIAEALSEPMSIILKGVKDALENTPPELAADLGDTLNFNEDSSSEEDGDEDKKWNHGDDSKASSGFVPGGASSGTSIFLQNF